jgi:uncharacterized protein (TIGR04255 family)
MSADQRLPVRLGKSPLVEALFELRFTASMPVSSILAGYLYTQLGCTEIIKLPHADIPDQVRQMDANLTYLPVIRIKWQDYYINIGDRSIVISDPFPYTGWAKFSNAIKTILNHCATTKLIQAVERFSVKYIDIFDMPGFSPDGKGFNFSLNFPGIPLNNQSTHARIEINEEPWLHIVQYFGEAHGNLADGTSKRGIMVDVDTIETLHNHEFNSFLLSFDEKVNALHSSNKFLFFQLVSDDGLKSLEPQYD